MEKLKQIWNWAWSHLVTFGKLLKKWFTEDTEVLPKPTLLEKNNPQKTEETEELPKSKMRLRKKKKSTKLKKSKK